MQGIGDLVTGGECDVGVCLFGVDWSGQGTLRGQISADVVGRGGGISATEATSVATDAENAAGQVTIAHWVLVVYI